MGQKRVEYPFSKVAVYWCAIISVLSVATSFLVLHAYTILLMFYFVIVAVVTFVMVKLKLRYLLKRRLNSLESCQKKNTKPVQNAGKKWGTMLLILGFILGAFLLIISICFLDPAIWFMCLNSFVTSLSVSEVFLYLYLNRRLVTVKSV